MALNHEQKKYLKKNLRSRSLIEISKYLNVEKKQILEYLKKIWDNDKYQRYLEQEQTGGVNSPLEKTNKKVNFWEIVKKNYWSIIFLLALVIIAYFNGLNNGFTSDDITAIPKNPDAKRLYYQGFPNFLSIRNYVYWFVANTFGIVALWYRIFNVFFHFSTVLMIFFILLIWTNRSLALFAASIIAVHPIFIESVTWISGGHSAYSGFLALLSLFLYMVARLNKQDRFFWASLISFILGLATLNKIMAFPGIILFYEICFGDLKKNWKQVFIFFLPGLLFAYSAATQIGARQLGVAAESYTDVIKPNFLVQLPVALTSYLELLVWPDKLSLYQSELAFSIPNFIFRVFLCFLYFATMIYSFFKNKFIFFWLIFFIIALSPTLTPFGVGWVFAERYGYLGVIGLIVCFAYLLDYLSKFKKLQPIVEILFIIMIVAFLMRTIVRNMDWKNEDTLWIATGRTAPSSPSTHNNLGDTYARQGNYQKAIEEFETVLKLNPRHADATHNLGNVYHMTGNTPKAIEFYEKALKMNPNLWQSYQNLGIIYFQQKQFDISEEYMQKAIKINPRNTDLYTSYAVMLYTKNDKVGAKAAILKAIEYGPTNLKAREILKQFK